MGVEASKAFRGTSKTLQVLFFIRESGLSFEEFFPERFVVRFFRAFEFGCVGDY